MSAFLGVGLAIVGTFCSAVGYTLQKTAHNRAAAEWSAQQKNAQRIQEEMKRSGETAEQVVALDRLQKKKSYWRYWQFPAGLGFLILGAVFAIFVFGLAGQSELAPMGAVTMIFNTILAWRFLGEPFTKIDLIATSLMALGTTVAIAFGESSDKEYELDQLIDLLDRRVVWATFGIEMFLIISMLVYVHTIGRRPVPLLSRKQANLDTFSRSFLGGAISGFTGFLTKSSVEVAFNAVDKSDGDDFTRWELYAFLVALGCCLFLQLKYMNSGLGRYDSMVVIPIYQSVLVIAAATSGLVYFDEISEQSDTSVTLFIVGCCITTAGIIVLLFKTSNTLVDKAKADRTSEGVMSPSGVSLSAVSPDAKVVDDGEGMDDGEQKAAPRTPTSSAARSALPVDSDSGVALSQGDGHAPRSPAAGGGSAGAEVLSSPESVMANPVSCDDGSSPTATRPAEPTATSRAANDDDDGPIAQAV